MCKDDSCPIKDSCRRFTAEPGFLQSYFIDSPMKDGKCDMYWGESQQQIMNTLIDIVNSKL